MTVPSVTGFSAPSGTNYPYYTFPDRRGIPFTCTFDRAIDQYQVQVLITGGGMVYDSGAINTLNPNVDTNAQGNLPRLADGNWTVQVRGHNASGFGAYGQQAFVLSGPPPVPTPVDPGPVNTDLPTLQCSIYSNSTLLTPVKAVFQIAQDAGFTVGLRTLTQTDNLFASHFYAWNTPITVDTAHALNQGTWYFRCAGLDNVGDQSAWSHAQQFVVSHPPTATNMTPSGGASVPTAGSYVFGWQWSDTSPTDVQSAYEVICERNDTGANIFDSGVVTSSTDVSYSHAITSADKDLVLRWKMRLTDSDGVIGDWTPYNYFYIRDAATVTITTPVAASVVTNPTPNVQASVVASSGRTIAKYKVVFTLPGAVTYDSGWQVGTVGNIVNYTPPQSLYTNGDAGSVVVTIIDSAGVQASSASTAFTVAFSAPASITPTVNVTFGDTNGYGKITWTQTTRDATFYSWRVYRKLTSQDSTGWQLVQEFITPQTGNTCFDYGVPLNVSVDYAIAQVATRFAAQVESVKVIVSGTVTSTAYWLVCGATPSMSVRLAIPSSDKFKDEYEQSSMTLMGRGRHVDTGTRLGYNGTLTVLIRDDSVTGLTAGAVIDALVALKAQGGVSFLKNAFGRVWQVVTGDMEIDRLAGVGGREFGTLSMPYLEVAQ